MKRPNRRQQWPRAAAAHLERYAKKMSDSSQDRLQCSAGAIDVAWKLRRGIYREVDGAVRALKRVQSGVTADEALGILATAEKVILEAIRVVEPKDEAMVTAYRSRVPNGPAVEDRTRCERELASRFPECTDAALRRALSNAVIYHIL